jgi:hypothetical protein
MSKKPERFYFTIKNAQERAKWLTAGIDLPSGKTINGKEFVTFDIAEDDPRWKVFCDLLREKTLEGLSEARPLLKESRSISPSQPPSEYSRQTLEELLSLEGKTRTDFLVMACEDAIQQKIVRVGKENLTQAEITVVAVEALEREVNNGGYDQFFVNSSRNFVWTIVDSLKRIGCEKTARITDQAIAALGITDLTPEAIEKVMAKESIKRRKKFNQCNDAYYQSGESIEDGIFGFIKANKAGIKF